VSYRLLSLIENAPVGFQYRPNLEQRDVRRWPFALLASDRADAEAALAPFGNALAGIIVTFGAEQSWLKCSALLFHLIVPHELQANLAQLLHSHLVLLENCQQAENRNKALSQDLARAHVDSQRNKLEFALIKESLLEELSERRRAEEALRASEEKYRAMIEAFDGYVYICSKDFRIQFMSEKLIQRTGRDATGEHCYKALHDLDSVCEWCVNEQVFAGKSVRWEIKSPKDGRWYEINNSPIYNTNGTISKQAMITDITVRKLAEEEKVILEAQLQQAQKMESVGRLAGGVAHDFNNMLSVILGYAHLGLMGLDPTQPLHDYFTEICKAADKSADLTRQLLAFARKQTIVPKVLDLNKTVAGMLKMLQRLIGEDIDLSWQPAALLWPIKMDPSQIDQILANLCVNARDAISGVGKITIKTENSTLNEDYCAPHVWFEPGEYVQLEVNDDGCGMDAETLIHIFEPFFTTKGVGEGTGLGLATVYGAVKQNNGFIIADSKPGSGTTFTIYLPRHVGSTTQTLSEGATEPARRGKEAILVVEDEQAILDMTTLILRKQGYTVLQSTTPSDAIRQAKEHVGEISLLVTDVVMPEMNGRDLANTLLSLYPHLKLLFMSGYTADVIAHHGVIDEGLHFIRKPFTLPDLAAKVREVLDVPPSQA
jgi:two-component system cell cycle sensor histidine kinase/response regulator CckA